MLAAISRISFSNLLTKEEAAERLEEIKKVCASLMQEYQHASSKEDKSKCLIALKREEDAFETVGSMIGSEDEYGLEIVCWGLRRCFQKVEEEIEKWGGVQNLELVHRYDRERTNSCSSNVADLLQRDTNLSEIAWNQYVDQDYKNYKEKEIEIEDKKKYASGFFDEETESDKYSFLKRESHAKYQSTFFERTFSDEHSETQVVQKEINDLIEQCNLPLKDKQNLKKSDLNSFLLIQKRIQECDDRLSNTDSLLERNNLEKERKKLSAISRLFTKINRSFKWFFSKKNPFLTFIVKLKPASKEKPQISSSSFY